LGTSVTARLRTAPASYSISAPALTLMPIDAATLAAAAAIIGHAAITTGLNTHTLLIASLLA